MRIAPSCAALLACLPLSVVHARPAVPDDPVGVNLNSIEYWTSGFVTADLAKRGQEWLLGSGSPTLAATNTAGWPLEPSTSRVVISTYQRFERFDSDPDDVMVLRYHEGSASASVVTDVDAFGPGVTEVRSSRDASGTVTKEYTVVGAQAAITLRANSLNSKDTAGNGDALDPGIELWIDKAHMRRFDQDPTQVFHDFYVQRLRSITPGQLRTSATWSRALHASATLKANGGGANRDAYDPLAQPRLQPDAPRYSGALPVPWELHAWIANEVDADIWVSIPFMYYDASDGTRRAAAEAYVKDMARTLRDELEPGRTCIVEFSNEMWNSVYATWQVLDEKEGPMRPDKVVRFVVDAFQWFAEEWNDDRVEFVAMGFTGDTRWVEEQTEALKGLGLVDAVGCGGYFFPEYDDAEAWGDANPGVCGSLDETDGSLEGAAALSMLRMIDNNVPFDGGGRARPGLTHALRAHGDVALDLEAELGRPIGLYVYEGGPSLLTNCQQLQQLYARFQHDSPYTFWLLYYELRRFVDGYRTGPDVLMRPLGKRVERFTVHAFCQPQNPQYGDWLLLTDLYAGIPGVSVVDPQIQWKFEAVRLFNAVH